jgi:5-oxoprolinase (ATP-hydrolysing)
MPPTSKTIFEEGAQVKSFKIVEAGVFQRDELVRLLVDEPAKCVRRSRAKILLGNW